MKELFKEIWEEVVEETWFDFKRQYFHWVLFAILFIALAYGTTMACSFLNNGQPCQIALPK